MFFMDYLDLDQSRNWPALARRVGWVSVAVAVARAHHVALLPLLLGALGNLLFLWLVSFGVLEIALVCAVEAAARLVLALEDAAYALSDWLVAQAAGEIAPPARFLAAFSAEVALVFAATRVWTAADLGARLALLLARAIR